MSGRRARRQRRAGRPRVIPPAVFPRIVELLDEGKSTEDVRRMLQADGLQVSLRSVQRAAAAERGRVAAVGQLVREAAVASPSAGWPPPVPEGVVWRRRNVGRTGSVLDLRQVLVRECWLWGRAVEIDEAGEVWCPCCMRMLSVEFLGSAEGRWAGHPVALRLPRGALGSLL